MMKAIRPVLALCALLLLCCSASAQIPLQMNYQVMLTDDVGEPLADTSVQLVFRVYDVEAGGGSIWTEVHHVTTNSIGVVSVILGAIAPMELDFRVPLWLEVEVDEAVMEPRRPLTAAPYAIRAQAATNAEQAFNSDNLGEIPAEAYTLDNDLWHPGTLNDPANPIDWTKLKSVPAGFADGIDDAGTGDGHSLDAADGDPVDVVSVDEHGYVEIGVSGYHLAKLDVRTDPAIDMQAGHFETGSDLSIYPAVHAYAESTSGIVSNSYTAGYWVPSTPTAVCGIASGVAHGGVFTAMGSGRGVDSESWGTGSSVKSEALGDGFSGEFIGGGGVDIEIAQGLPALHARNTATGGLAGDAAWFGSQPGASSLTWTVYSECYNGVACRMVKLTDDNEYAAEVLGVGAGTKGLYVQGSIFTTAPLAQGVNTARGTEAVFGVTSNEVEVIASGEGVLAGGKSRVDFARLFAESIAGDDGLRVTVSPIGAWSAIYVAGIDGAGFDVRSEAGDANVEFHWVAVGRSRDHQRRPDVTIPDDEADRLLAERKRTEVESRRPQSDEDPGVVEVGR